MAFSVPAGLAGVAGLLGLAPQTWQDRLREAAYTSPAGLRVTFSYEDLSREFDKRGTAFDYPGVNNSYVQQNGHSSRRYPMRVIFSGPDCDQWATVFEAALLEDGIGKLEHPLYGTLDVVPFGQITRRDDLKSAANQSIIEVTFWTTLGAVYPNVGVDPQSEIGAALAAFNLAAADQFAAAADLGDTLKKANLKNTIRKFLREVSAALESAADSVASVRNEFADAQSLVNFGIDVLVGQPLLLAQQVTNLINAPARAITGIESRLDAYQQLASRVLGSLQATPAQTLASGVALTTRTSRIANDFHFSDLVASSAVGGSILSVIGDAQFTTKPQALEAAEAIEAQVEELVAWRDAGFAALGQVQGVGSAQVDTGESYQALQNAAALAVGYLVQISFTLVPERRIVLDRDRTIIDVAAELYGDVDGKLDFLIGTNELTGDEILELPRGKMLVYYP